MGKLGIYITKMGKPGDLTNGWRYCAFFGEENWRKKNICAFISYTTITPFNNHLVLNEIFIDWNKFNKNLFGIESLENIQKADERAYERINTIAAEMLEESRKKFDVDIINKTGNKKSVETRVK